MKTAPSDILIALLLWVGVLSQPMFQHLTGISILKNVYQYIISPLAIMALSRTGRFWVKKSVIITSIMLSALVSLGINRLDYFSDDNINERKLRYILFNIIHLLTFAFVFILMGVFTPLYKMSNFNV